MAQHKKNQPSEQENPLFHDTWKLLKNYRDAVWILKLAVQKVGNTFEVEGYAKSMERSNKMLQLLDSAVDILRSRHKHGEQYYWILYYTYLSSQQLQNTDEIIDKLKPHIVNISRRTYYRKRPEAVQALSSILWGDTTKNGLKILDTFY